MREATPWAKPRATTAAAPNRSHGDLRRLLRGDTTGELLRGAAQVILRFGQQAAAWDALHSELAVQVVEVLGDR
ncbi:MAG: hypothetical protein H0T39_03970 [Actinobacteria bacterium]|nr:hypothetical protein [Actinomycetota bacterium]